MKFTLTAEIEVDTSKLMYEESHAIVKDDLFYKLEGAMPIHCTLKSLKYKIKKEE